MTSILDISKLFSQLNTQQLKAVHQLSGPLLVVAGAGSGKTRVIIARIGALIEYYSTEPSSIIALTFTNKAANEMKERIAPFCKQFSNQPFIGTFHSFCLKILKEHRHLLDFPEFTILDASDQQHLLNLLLKKSGTDKKLTPKKASYHISKIKNGQTAETSFYDYLIRDLYAAYEKEKKQSHCFDFDDLLLEVDRLFATNNEFRQSFQQKINHILIDEYQDTNIIQHRLLKYMALQDSTQGLAVSSVCAVGDEDQSIYSWRGATLDNMLSFTKDFSNTIVVKIEQNYRSAQPILQVANTLIKHNTQRTPKTLWSEKTGSDRVRVIRYLSGYQEGEALVHFVNEAHKSQKTSTIAVLYRAHYQSRALEEALIRHSMAYSIVGGIAFYERKEIKDILAYLRLIVNPFDRVSFTRVINCPARGLGQKFIDQFMEFWDHNPFSSLQECVYLFTKHSLIKGIKSDTLQSFVSIISIDQEIPINRAIEHIITRTHYFLYLTQSFDHDEAEGKIENVKELLRAATFAQENGTVSIKDFLHEISLMQEHAQNTDLQEPSVTLMTLHAAKGLEFDCIMLAGLEEGLFPSSRAIIEREGIEEERRLLYVGITRAKERLLLSYANHRYTFGSMNDQQPSRFLKEIPEHLVARFDATYFNPIQLKQFFTQWFNTHISHILTFPATKNIESDEKSGSSSTTFLHTFKINNPVKHKTFGIGIVKNIEQRGNTAFVTVQFKDGIKKVKASFLSCT